MFRKALAEFLLNSPMTVPEIARLVGAPLKDVADDLAHLERSLRRGTRRMRVHPAVCRGCGFTFSAEKVLRPGKCPKCRGTWISEPRVEVVAR